MRVPLRPLLLAGLVTTLLVGGGVLWLDDDEEEAPAPRDQPFRTIPLADYDAAAAAVARGPFCDAVDDRQVEAALGQPATPSAWANGDRIDLGAGRPDVVHEYGCSYTATDGGQARAWVFAPPVDATRAARLVRSAGAAPGCETGGGPPFGSPTLALVCTDDAGMVRASHRGLLGDAWVVCELSLPGGAAEDIVDRAGRWCVGVLQAASARPPAPG